MSDALERVQRLIELAEWMDDGDESFIPRMSDRVKWAADLRAVCAELEQLRGELASVQRLRQRDAEIRAAGHAAELTALREKAEAYRATLADYDARVGALQDEVAALRGDATQWCTLAEAARACGQGDADETATLAWLWDQLGVNLTALRGARSWERWAVVDRDNCRVWTQASDLDKPKPLMPSERVIRVRITEIPEVDSE